MVTAILVAAGKGARMGEQTIPKQFLCVEGRPILGHTLRKFETCNAIDQIVLVIRRRDRSTCERIISECGAKKVTGIVEGGKERQDSVFQGLLHVQPQTDVVLIHDAVRMFVTEQIIVESIRAARQYGASVVAVPVKDTIKQVGIRTVERSDQHIRETLPDNEALFVVKTLDRKTLWQVQTPQTFQYQRILEIYQKAQELGIYGTDDAMLAEYFGYMVKIVRGTYRNIKITTPDDLLIAQAFLQDERRIEYSISIMFRVGIRYDVHRLVEHRKLILGGVEIPFEKGLLGHSDADVLTHAICDAILGALGLGDIGRHFPDSDPAYKGISSLTLLSDIVERMHQKRYKIGNVDAIIIAQKPRLSNYIEEMRANLSSVMRTSAGVVNVKATTTEGLGFTGTCEGIAAQAIVNIVYCS